ncbi:MAG: polysaccharide deacetylase family protein [Akkermansiaceae bacterium]
MRRLAITLVVTVAFLRAQEAAPTLESDNSRVSVLGYHVFSSSKPATQMLIPTAKFRDQMNAIKASGIPVIDMPQFLSWRRGQSKVPPQSFLITMDDGWKSVYTEAWPVMKELKLPFTIYLYKNYVGSDRGGRALSIEMINEMVDSGLCSIGSHSVSHPFPSKVKKHLRQGTEAYQKFLRTELGDSKRFLEDKFDAPVTTYAYPGGFLTPEMFPVADEVGYDHLFTVKPGKISLKSNKYTLPRYIVLGNHDGAFNAAMIFRSGARLTGDELVHLELPHPTRPGPGHIVSSRLPRISADLSAVKNLDPENIVMRVGGFGKVPAVWNPETKEVAWTVSRPLRQISCEVSVQWRLKGKTKYEPVMKWSFAIDRVANYQSQ